MLELPDPGVLPEAAARAGFGRIEVLLFVRDPVPHAASVGQQLVKRHGAAEGPDALIERFDQPLKAAELLDRLAALDGRAGVAIGLTVRNYAVCRDRLLAEAEAWLGVPEGTLPPPPAARANRGLSAPELALQRALNRALGAAADAHGGRMLADPLCERLPDIPADPFRASPEAQRRMLDRLAPAMARVNARMPEAHRYRAEIRAPEAPPAAPGRHAFTDAQLAVIAEGAAAETLRLRAEIDRLRRAPEEGIGARTLARALLRRLTRRLRGR